MESEAELVIQAEGLGLSHGQHLAHDLFVRNLNVVARHQLAYVRTSAGVPNASQSGTPRGHHRARADLDGCGSEVSPLRW
jgi:hypothetical protein